MTQERTKRLLLAGVAAAQRLMPRGLRLSRRLAGHRIYFDPATDIGMTLLVTGRFEPGALAQCGRFIRPDGIVVDVGANIGVHAVHFARFASSGKVICLEPAGSTFATLLRNVHGLRNIIPLNIGLSDSTGLKPFYIAADDAYSGLKDTQRKAIMREETVACFRGDEILPSLVGAGRVDLVKIDVEGLESQVLAGMKEFLLAHRPAIFCEIFGGTHSNPDPQSTVRFCTGIGYDPYVLQGDALTPVTTHDDRAYNYFFIPRTSGTTVVNQRACGQEP